MNSRVSEMSVRVFQIAARLIFFYDLAPAGNPATQRFLVEKITACRWALRLNFMISDTEDPIRPNAL